MMGINQSAQVRIRASLSLSEMIYLNGLHTPLIETSLSPSQLYDGTLHDYYGDIILVTPFGGPVYHVLLQLLGNLSCPTSKTAMDEE